MTDISKALEHALQNDRFRSAAESLARAFLEADDWQLEQTDEENRGGEWAALRREHYLQLLERFAQQGTRGERLEYEDIGDKLNPLRALWLLCFTQFAKRSVKATNHVTERWKTSAQDDKNFQAQQAAVARGVTIERTYILEQEDLPEQTLHDLRYAIVRQLNAGVQLRVIKPSEVEAYTNTSKLKTKDFIIFDGLLVYTTRVDTGIDRREQRNTYVKLSCEKGIVEYAAEAWDEICSRADELTYENLHRFVDPYGIRLSDDK